MSALRVEIELCLNFVLRLACWVMVGVLLAKIVIWVVFNDTI